MKSNLIDSTVSNIYNKITQRLSTIFSGPNADQNNNYNRSKFNSMGDISDSYYEIPNDQTFSIVAFLGVILGLSDVHIRDDFARNAHPHNELLHLFDEMNILF